VKPVGLTRAEEALEEVQPQKARVAAPPGTVRCRSGAFGDCPAAATCQIVYQDGDKAPACAECALHMQQLAESNRSSVRIEPLRNTTIDRA
jgi:hypothetical protein